MSGAEFSGAGKIERDRTVDEFASGRWMADLGEPLGPNGVACAFEDQIASLETTRSHMSETEQKITNKRIREIRELLRFCKSRAGYIEPSKR